VKSICHPLITVHATAHPGPRTIDDYSCGIEKAVTAFSRCYLCPPAAKVISYLSICCRQASI